MPLLWNKTELYSEEKNPDVGASVRENFEIETKKQFG
jgi:hypothetical protein